MYFFHKQFRPIQNSKPLKKQFLVFLQPSLADPAGQMIEYKFLGLLQWPPFWNWNPILFLHSQ